MVQLGLDGGEEVRRLTDPLRARREEMHGCLGCDPCPPSDAFAQYLTARAQKKD